jgi:hypothetical protein
MTVEAFGHFATGVLVASCLVAIAALVSGFVRPSSARAAAWTCAATVILTAVSGVAGYLFAMSSLFAQVSTADPAGKAAMLAQGISEALNCGAFVAVALIPTSFATVVLFARSRKKR